MKKGWKGLMSLALVTMVASGFAQMSGEVSAKFEGVKANTGTVTHLKVGNKDSLVLSDDFTVPDSPAPHWQIVDTLGNVYLLDSLKLKGDRISREIVVPTYIHDIAKVQMWCAWAEVLLGETRFEHPIVIGDGMEHRYDVHTSKKFEGVKANTGTVTHYRRNGVSILTLSEDFKTPDAPAPTWRVIDSKGKIYLLKRLTIKGDRINRTIEVPAYVRDIAKVQIYCAWAQVVLGETDFGHVVK